jgi:hypothetical protein
MRDALNRRKRFAGRHPHRVVALTPRDLGMFEVLDCHGWLPTTYIAALLGASRKKVVERLNLLFHSGYVYRPSQQQNAYNAPYQALTYALDEAGRKALGSRANQKATPPGGWALHQFMVSCITASIELACRKHGFKFITQEQIITGSLSNHPSLDLQVRKGKLIPDQLFGIKYPDGKHRFFALEADRATEDRERFDMKTAQYHDVFVNKTYKSAWGIQDLKCLVVTTSSSRIDRIISATNKHFLFQAYDHFEHWNVPPVLYSLITAPWRTKDGNFDITRP